MEEKILTPDQVAQILQVHPFTVLKFIKQGKLRASKLGRVYRIRQSDVNHFLDEQEATASSKAPSKKAPEGPSKEEASNAQPAKSKKHVSPENEASKPKAKESERTPSKHNQSENKQQTRKNEFDHYILD